MESWRVLWRLNSEQWTRFVQIREETSISYQPIRARIISWWLGIRSKQLELKLELRRSLSSSSSNTKSSTSWETWRQSSRIAVCLTLLEYAHANQKRFVWNAFLYRYCYDISVLLCAEAAMTVTGLVTQLHTGGYDHLELTASSSHVVRGYVSTRISLTAMSLLHHKSHSSVLIHYIYQGVSRDPLPLPLPLPTIITSSPPSMIHWKSYLNKQ